jgi:hypothetical protein
MKGDNERLFKTTPLYTLSIITLAMGSQLRQGLARLRAKKEAQE